MRRLGLPSYRARFIAAFLTLTFPLTRYVRSHLKDNSPRSLLPPTLQGIGGSGGGPSSAIHATIHVDDPPWDAIKHPICHENPYRSSIEESFEGVYDRANGWVMAATDFYERESVKMQYGRHDHQRFFVFNEMAECKNLTCVGGECSDDTSKHVCGLDQLNGNSKIGERCVIYSIGGNNEWEFENDLLDKTDCEVHTFDCTGPMSRFEIPEHERLQFHHVCLGTNFASAPKNCNGGYEICGEFWTMDQMQQNLGHTRIDLLKLDIEGFEWPLFDFVESSTTHNSVMPMQMLMEVHYGLGPGVDLNHTHGINKPVDLVRFQKHLLQRGFVVVKRDDNVHCKHCTELTLLRIAC